MKDKSLLRKRLKRAALLVLLLCVAGLGESLAQNQVAILQHGEETTAFYGANAFVQAHTAAVDGDIITLSGLSFNVPSEVTKSITLRGAGVTADTVAGTQATVLSGVTFNVPYVNDSITLSVEGISFIGSTHMKSLVSPVFTKCNFDAISGNSYYPSSDAQFINCKICSFNCYYFTNTTFINSVVNSCSFASSSYNVLAYNSILRYSTNVNCFGFEGLSAYNSILINDATNSTYHQYPASTCVFVNCIGIEVYYIVFNGYTSNCITTDENGNALTYADVFETYDGTSDYYDDEPYTLTEFASGFMGTDGTQVGIYGGGYAPYTDKPSYVVRTQVTVPNRSNNEGKLNVEIEIIDEDE